MTSSTKLESYVAAQPSLFGNQLSICDRPSETARAMRVLERLALTLGVPVETFFEQTDQSATPDDELGELTGAFLAIRDPVMRRYCLDIVKLAGVEAGSAGAGRVS